jgi:hypothetical protein
MRILSLLALLILSACAPESVNKYHTGENEEEIVSLLNAREYSKAIWLIENREGRNPRGETGFLLAQAYLGRAGIEPLAFAARVTEAEPDTAEARALFPKCPRGRINAKEVEMKCLLKRVYLQAPPADEGDFARARELFRTSYPDPASAPVWVNTLIGMVDTISLVRRAGDLFIYSKGVKRPGGKLQFNPNDVQWLKGQGKESLRDAKEALGRANYAGDKVSRFLSGVKANEWFERVEGTLEFAKTVGLSRFLDFVRENLLKQTDEIRYGQTLDRLKVTLDLLDQ